MGMFVAHTPVQKRAYAEAMRVAREVRTRPDGTAYNMKTGKPVFGGRAKRVKKESLQDYQKRMKSLGCRS